MVFLLVDRAGDGLPGRQLDEQGDRGRPSGGSSNLDEARTLMAVTTKDIRTATRLQAGTSPFVQATNTDVTFYANLNNTTGGPRKIRIYVDPTKRADRVGAEPGRRVGRAQLHVHRAGQAPRSSAATSPTPSPRRSSRTTTTAGTPLPAPLTSSGSARGVLGEDHPRRSARPTTFPVADTTLVNQVRLPNVDYQQATGG